MIGIRKSLSISAIRKWRPRFIISGGGEYWLHSALHVWQSFPVKFQSFPQVQYAIPKIISHVAVAMSWIIEL